MGIFADAYAQKSASMLEVFADISGSKKSKSGVNVNSDNAIDVSTVFACCRVIGEGVAQVPLQLMQVSADGKTRAKAVKHQLYDKLASKPNRWQTSFEWRETVCWHVALTGNHYSFVNRIGNKIIELFPFEPKTVETIFKDGVLTYKVTPEGGQARIFPQESILHVRGPSTNSWLGLSAVKHAREAIGLAMATEGAAASLHKNGARPSGTYTVPGKLSPTQYKDLSKWVEDHFSGSENAGKPLILDSAATWVSTQMSGIDAQSLEQRRFQIEEICRFMRVMPIMVGHSDKASTYASAEQMFLAHVVHTLAPWFTRLEQSFDNNLLTDKERAQGYYFNFVEEGLLRGSSVDTKDMILGYVNGGLFTPNQGLAKLDMNPDPDPASDKLRIPTNIVGNQPQTTPPGTTQ